MSRGPIRDLNHAANVVAVSLANSKQAGIEYAPGNGTQFKLVFLRPEIDTLEGAGLPGGRVLVALPNFGTAFHFAMAPVNWTYVAEKLGLKYESDAQALADLFAAIGEYRPHAMAVPAVTE